MFSKKLQPKRSEDIKKSAAKVLDAKKDTPTRAKHLRLFLDNAEVKNLCFLLLSASQEHTGRLFSQSDISKKLSHHFLLHFWIDMGSYDHHAKY